MTMVSSRTDAETLSLTMVAEFPASPERVWQVWEDPRQLERWWGPPGYPATFPEHDFRPGGSSRYFMTGPDGEKNLCWWRTVEIDRPFRLVFQEGFADESWQPVAEMGAMTGEVLFEPLPDGGTRMTTTSRFESVEQMQQMLEMGMEEGMRQAMGQIDALLEEVSV